MTVRIHSPDGDRRPHIPVGVDLERMTDQAIGALATDARVYQRGGMLVGVVTVPEGPAKLVKGVKGVKRAPGSQVIVPLEAATVCERLSSAARWTRYDVRTKSSVGALPPKPAVSAVMGRREWGGVRSLVSVATSPQLRPDGSILQAPGYDAHTGILYWPSDTFPGVTDEPSIDDARGALAALREVCCDFPFARPEHESAWLAGLLTLLARPAIDGPVPLIAVDATTAGTGKSRLVDAATRLAYGHDAARTSMPDEDDEMRKRITAIVLEGDPAVCVDNIRRRVDLPSLEAVLTAMTWKDRLLGQSRQASAPHRTTWWLTANNVELGGDLARRTLHVRLESRLEKPEERPESDFKHPNLLRWVDGERTSLVSCALTLLRAYVVAGRPDQKLQPWGSFEAWTALVPGALVWVGAESPLLAKATQVDSIDDDKRALLIVHDSLQRLLPDTWASVRDILDALYPERERNEPLPKDGFEDLRDVLAAVTRSMGRTPDARKLGKYFEKVRGRVISSRRLVRLEDAHRKMAVWRTETV